MVGTRRLLVGELERECSCAAVGDVTIVASLSLASHDRKVGSVSRVCEASWIGGGWRQTPPVPRRCLCIGPHAGVARPYTSEASRNICIRFGHLNIPGHSPPSTPIVLIPRLYPPPSGSHPHGRVQWAFLPPSAPPLPREFTPPVCCCISRRAVEISWRIHLWMKPRCLESAWGGGAPPSPSLSPSLSPTFGSAISRHSDTSSRSQLPLSLLRAGKDNPMLVELKNGETYNGILVNCDIWMNLSLRDVVCTSRVRHSHRTRHHHHPQNANCLISRRTGSLVL